MELDGIKVDPPQHVQGYQSRPMMMSEEQRIAGMEMEMYKHLNRAKALQLEISRAKNALMHSRGNIVTQTDPTAYRRLDPRTIPQFGGTIGNQKTISRTLPTDFKNPKMEMRSTTNSPNFEVRSSSSQLRSWQRPQGHWRQQQQQQPQRMDGMGIVAGMSNTLSPQHLSQSRSFTSQGGCVPAYQMRPQPTMERKVISEPFRM